MGRSRLRNAVGRLATYAELVANGSSGKELASASTTTVQTLISTDTDVTNLSITFTVGSRPVWVLVDLAAISGATAAVVFSAKITDGSNVLKQLRTQTVGSANFTFCTIAERISTPGTYTRKVRVGRAGGTGTVSVGFDTTTPSTIRAVEA